MVWAATKTSLANGAWSTAGTWNPAGVPSQNDYVAINHTVYINTSALAAGIYVHGGLFRLTAGGSLTIKDAAGTHDRGEHILISENSASGFISEGTKAAPFLIKSESATPTYPIKMLEVPSTTKPDPRPYCFDYLEMRNIIPSIGNTANYLFFNTGNVTVDGVLDVPSPLRRDQKIDQHYCEGRSYGRIYPEGGHAGVIELSGLVPWTGYAWQTLIAMRDARVSVSYFGQFSSVGIAAVESLRFGSRDGPYLPFTMTLVEQH